MSESEDILLAQWLSGEISDSDLEKLQNSHDLKGLKDTLVYMDQYAPETIASDNLWSKIDTEKKLLSKKQYHVRRYIFLGLLTLALVSVLIFLFNLSSDDTIKTGYETNTTKLFADGSEILIGPNSKIDYNEQNWSKERILELTGQAFFKVNKGAPFSVKTNAGTVEVLGTQFDVWCIDSKHMRVTCKEGTVRVSDLKGQSKTITANQYVYITMENIGEIEISNNFSEDWINNFRNYKTTPIKVVLDDIERFYHTTFSIESELADDVFTGTLPVNDLSKCIRYIESSLLYESKSSNNNVQFRKAN